MAERRDVAAGQPVAGEQAGQHQVDDVPFRAAGAAGSAEDRGAFEFGEQQQVAGVDGRSVADDGAAGGLDGARRQVVAILDGRFAGEDQEIDVRGECGRRRREFLGLLLPVDRYEAHLCELGAQRAEPLPEGLREAGHQPFASGRLAGGDGPGDDQPGGARRQRVEPDKRVRRHALGGGDGVLGQSVGEDLRRPDHLARSRHAVVRQRGQGDAVAVVDAVEGGGVDAQHSQRLRVQVDAAGRRPAQVETRSGNGFADPPGGLVLVDVAGFQPCREDPVAAETGQQIQLRVAEGAALAQYAAAVVVVDVVAEDGALSLAERRRFELHFWA